MNFLILSGAPNTGKTTAINGLAYWLTVKLGARIIDTKYPITLGFQIDPVNRTFHDLSIVVVLNDKKIILHSATDDEYTIDTLTELIDQHPDAHVVITSCRDLYHPRRYFYNKIQHLSGLFSLEVPRARITRRNDYYLAENWYDVETLKQYLHILSNIPFNI